MLGYIHRKVRLIVQISFLNGNKFATTCLSHYADSSTECGSGSVRLVSGSVLEGFVEVCIFRKWYPVCSDTFDPNAAQVTCQFLGYNATEGYIHCIGINV